MGSVPDPRLPCTGAGAPSPLRFGAVGHGSGSDRPVRRLIGAPTAPPLPCCAVADRGFPARAAPRLGRRSAQRPQPAQVSRRRWRGPIPSRTFVTPRNMKDESPSPACSRRAGDRRAARTRGRIAQRGGGGAVGAPMRRRGRRRPKRYRRSSSRWWTVITTRPLGSEVVRAPCLRQKQHVSARSESSSGRRLLSSASSRLPQWQRPVSGASLRDVSWPLIAPLALDLAPVPPREVNDLELHPVRIGEEDRVILRAVLGVLRRRIEDRDPLAHEEIEEEIHLIPAPHAELEAVSDDANGV